MGSGRLVPSPEISTEGTGTIPIWGTSVWTRGTKDANIRTIPTVKLSLNHGVKLGTILRGEPVKGHLGTFEGPLVDSMC